MLRLPTHHLCSCLAVPPRSSALHCSHGTCVAWLSPLVATRSVSVATAKHCTANPAAPPSHLLRSAFYWSQPTGGECTAYARHSSAYTGAKTKRMPSSTTEQASEHKAKALQMLRRPGRMLGEDRPGAHP